MRQQYHSRTLDGKNQIWDVHRLVELSRHFAIEQVPLAEIVELDFDTLPYGDD